MKRKIRIALLILCVLVCVGGLLYLYFEKQTREKNNDVYEEIKEQVQTETQEEPIVVVEEEPEEIPIDFAKLKKTNEDIYGWITIPGTRVDYPIVQHPTDDMYYLDHTIEGKKGYPGSIYTEMISAKDFSDFNTVIYGHNMKDGTMFKDLHKFEKEAFFQEHDTIDIYTETEHKVYKIFAAVLFDDRHLLYCFNYDNPEGRMEFVQSIYESHSMRNQFWDDVTVDADSHITTLSTCVGGQPTKRYLVLAVEVDE